MILVTNSLTSYMDKVRQLVRENPDIDPNTYTPDNRYNHMMQVHERLNFLRFLLKVIFFFKSPNLLAKFYSVFWRGIPKQKYF